MTEFFFWGGEIGLVIGLINYIFSEGEIITFSHRVQLSTKS